MFKNAMSSANQGTRKFSLCLHIRKFSRALIHRANAREPVKPQASRAALRTHGLHCVFMVCTPVCTATPPTRHPNFKAGGKSMKKKKAFLAAFLAIGMLTGCLGRSGGGTMNTESSRIYVTEEGALQTATVETYTQQDYYRADELKAYLEEAVSGYNEAHGQGAVTLDSCTLENGNAKMVFRYASGSDLAGFTSQYEDKVNQVDSITVTRVSDILEQSESEGVTFKKASDGKPAEKKALSNKGDCFAIVVETPQPVTIQTQGKLLFTSKNVSIKDHYTVQTAKGKNYIIFK